MPKKNEPSITGHLLTTIARTVGVTAGMIVNKTAELTDVAVQAAGATIKGAPKKKSAKRSARTASTTKRTTAKNGSTAKKRSRPAPQG
jgi:hypothetical protein